MTRLLPLLLLLLLAGCSRVKELRSHAAGPVKAPGDHAAAVPIGKLLAAKSATAEAMPALMPPAPKAAPRLLTSAPTGPIRPGTNCPTPFRTSIHLQWDSAVDTTNGICRHEVWSTDLAGHSNCVANLPGKDVVIPNRKPWEFFFVRTRIP
jgi:hypothetical protein